MIARVAPLATGGMLLLGFINIWLLIALMSEIAGGHRRSVETLEWKPQLEPLSDSIPDAKTLDAYKTILAQPVFFKSRQPFVPPPPPPPPRPPVPVVVASPPPPIDPGLILGGVALNRDYRKAYLFSQSDPRGNWVSEGDSFMGWKVELVDATRAKLQQGNRTIELQLYVQQ